MTPGRAQEINAAMMAHTMYEMGMRDTPPPSLKAYRLQEMLDATRMVAEMDGDIHCADRLVAALYVLTHYEGTEPTEISPVCHNGRQCVAVVQLPGGAQ